MDYYYAADNQQRGPVTLEQLAHVGLKPDTLVWHEGLDQWVAASSLPEVAALLKSSATTQPGGSQPGSQLGSQSGLQPATQAGQNPLRPMAPSGPYNVAPEPPANPPGTGPNVGYWSPTHPTPYGAAPLPNGMAVTSMVLGIVSIPMTCGYGAGLVPAILAVVFGHIARTRIRRGEASGDGMALTGLICGYSALGLVALFVLFIIAIAIIAAAS